MDILDGTPLLDIKPYVSRFDYRENARFGWQDNVNAPSCFMSSSRSLELPVEIGPGQAEHGRSPVRATARFLDQVALAHQRVDLLVG